MAEENPFLALQAERALAENLSVDAEENPFLALQAGTEEEDEDKPSTFTDIGRGIGAGLVNIPQGIAELGAAGVDVALGTNTSRATTEIFEDVKETLNLLPENTSGKIAEGIITYGSAAIPVVGWLGRANSVAKGAKVIPGKSTFAKTAEKFGQSRTGKTLLGNRAKLAGTTALAVGTADILVSPTSMRTLSDSFDALPDFLKTEEDTQLEGPDEAYRRLRNKLRFGAEGFGLGLAGELASPIIGAAVRAPAYVPGVPAAARLIGNAFDKTGQMLGNNTFLRKYFTAAGETPQGLYEGIEGVKNIELASTREAERRFKAFEQAAKKVVSGSRLFGRGREGIQAAHDDLYKFLTGEIDEAAMRSQYGDAVATAAKNMRNQVDGLTDIYIREIEDTPISVLPQAERDGLVQQFRDQQGSYLRKLYEAHLRPEDFVMDTQLYSRAVDQVSEGVRRQDPSLTMEESTQQAALIVNNALGRAGQEGSALSQQAILQGQANYKKGKPKTASGQPRALFNIAEGMLKDRTLPNSPVLKELLGEIKDPKELYFRTVGQMSETLAANQLYRQFARENMDPAARAAGVAIQGRTLSQANELFENGGRPLVIDGSSVISEADARLLTEDLGYVKLGGELDPERTVAQQVFGGKFGALTNAYVPKEVYDSLTIASRATGPLEEALAISLQAKGLSQMAKTVLNPLSQIRNFNSGVFMVGANGNIARNMDIFDSSRLTVGRIADLDDEEFVKTFNMLQKAGIVDQNYVVNEYRELLKEGADLTVAGKVGDIGRKIGELPLLRPVYKGAQNVYAGTDNYWKTVGYLGEKAKYSAAFRRAGLDPDDLGEIADDIVGANLAPRSTEFSKDMEFIDLMSTDIVKATMPTYSRVPEIVKQIRRIPVVGNFMAFPAEIIRTTTNITRQGLKELGFKASDDLAGKIAERVRRQNPNMTAEQALQQGQRQARILERQIRAIGAKRLSNYAAMAYVVPVAAQKAAMETLEFGEEKMEALKRFAPEFLQGHTLMPISDDGKGKVEYVDLTYMMPYDVMRAPVLSALQAYQNAGVVTDSQATQIMKAGQAAVTTLLEPFVGEGLLAERIADVTVRGGVTKTGAEIFVEGESDGDRNKKIFNHVIAGIIPGGVELVTRERRGEFEPGRVAKAFMGEPGRYGETFTTAEEGASMLTGFRELELDLNKNLEYKGFEYAGVRSDQGGVFKNVAKRNDATNEEILNAYIKANRSLMKAQSNLYEFVQNAKALGFDERDIRKQLKRDARLGTKELNLIMRGEFNPIAISQDLRKQIRVESVLEGQPRVVSELPLQELNDLRREFNRMPLVSTQSSVPSSVDAEENPFLALQSQTTLAPVAPVAPAPAPAPAPAAQPQQQQAPNRSFDLLGSNPIDALRNFEILQRITGGQ
jgi:hypothetical protein